MKTVNEKRSSWEIMYDKLKLETDNNKEIVRSVFNKLQEENSNLKGDCNLLEQAILIFEQEQKELKEINKELIEALHSLIGIEAWIGDPELKRRFQEKVYPALQKAKQ